MTTRETVHEITAGFERMAAWDRLGYPDLPDKDLKIRIYRQIYRQVAPKIRELEHYYASNEPWLTEDAKRILEPCIADGRDLADSLDRRRNTDDWSDELTDAIVRAGALRFRNHLDILDRYVSGVLGTQRPWWRRMFGT
jgi:hypothetical protein